MDLEATTRNYARVGGAHLFMVGAAIACGLAGALGAVILRILVRLIQAVAFSGGEGFTIFMAEGWLAEPTDPLESVRALNWEWRFLIPVIGGLLVGPICHFFAPEARGHGVPEVMKSVALRGGLIRARVAVAKAIASALTIGSGGSAGREGPIVQIGSAAGSTIGQLLNVPAAQMRTLVACGAAAGISATFNAPIGGALFAAEIIMADFAVIQLSPIVVSSVVATVVSRFFLGNHPAFIVPEYEMVSPIEIVPYMAAGVAAGLVAIAFIYSLHYTEEFFDRLKIPGYLKAAVGGLGVGCLGIFVPHIFGVGYSSITGALNSHLGLEMLALLLVAKILATSLTLGSGGSGGIFAPSLFLGAAAGGAVGTVIHQWFPDATASSGAYALVTMGAVVSATTHAPITAMIIIFELTQTIDIIPALMVACVISTLVSQVLSRDSIYTIKLRHQGFDFFEREDPNPLKGLLVREVIDREPEVIPASANFQTLLDLVVQSSHSQFFVLDEADQLRGAIALSEVRRLIYERDALQHVVVAGDLVDASRPTATEDDNLDVVLRLFSSGGVDEIAVVDRHDPSILVGTVREKDVIEVRNREMLRRDLAGGLANQMTAVQHGQDVDLGGGFALREILAPPRLFGATLRQVDLRARTGVQVLLIRRRRGATTEVGIPEADDRLVEGDALVVAGTREALAKLERLGKIRHAKRD